MKKTLLITLSLFVNLGGAILNAQYVDVTEQYIPNADFEACDALSSNLVHDNYANVDRPVVALPNKAGGGYDYAEQGWTLIKSSSNANGGVISYEPGLYIQHKSYNAIGDASPNKDSNGNTGKALVFQGNNSVIYKQTNSIELPAGTYRLTVNIWACYGGTTNIPEKTSLFNCQTGFIAENGTTYLTDKTKYYKFTSNDWDTNIIDIELKQATKGYFQISYGNSYFTVVDNLKLEYLSGVITSELQNLITKATALNNILKNNTDLATAIGNAEAFVAAPTTQDDVATEVEKLYNAMSTALATATQPLDITSAYIDNPSFETGKTSTWDGYGSVSEPVNELSLPYINGKKIYDYNTAGSNTLYQTISHLPTGYYMVTAKLNSKAQLAINTALTDCVGGVEYIYLRVHSNVQNITTSGDLKIGSLATTAYKIDDFRLFYGKDAASLEARLLADVKTDAQAILNDANFAAITGSERTAIETNLEGNDYRNINLAINTFVTSLDNYNKLSKKKGEAENYTQADYPYAKASLFDDIQTLVNTTATSETNATEMTTQLDNLYFQVYVSNAYCEGVSCTDYTENIKEANIGAASQYYWIMQNMSVFQLPDKAWKNPKTQSTDNIFFKTSSDYNYNTAEKKALALKQTLQGLPAGTYVLSMTMMASTNLNVYVFFNNNPTPIGTMVGKGTASGGKYGVAWNDYTFEFTKTGDDAQPLQIQCTPPNNNNKDLYIDNFRLYLLNNTTGIQNVQRTATDSQAIFDLQGRRIAQPAKGLYIVNGKKVIMK